MARPREPLKERFEKKFRVTPGCWPWTAGRLSKGYGCIGVGGRGSNNVGSHRVSYRLYVGEIPEGMQVLHKCDNKLCVNPDHLFLGTHADNMADRHNKGGYATGNDHWKRRAQ